MTARKQRTASTAPEATPDTGIPEATPEATPAPVDPDTPEPTPAPVRVTASIPEGQKSPALDIPPNWSGSRSCAVSDDGTSFAFIGNDGVVYQGLIGAASPRALGFGYAFGVKQKCDSDGAKNKAKTAETAETLTANSVTFTDWHSARVSGPREETATPLDLQIRALLIAKLKIGGLGAAVKAKKVKLTGFTGGQASLFPRYAAVVKEATELEATPDQWAGFVERTLAEAEAAIANIGEDPFA